MSFCFLYIVVTSYQGAASLKPLLSQRKSVPLFCSKPYKDVLDTIEMVSMQNFTEISLRSSYFPSQVGGNGSKVPGESKAGEREGLFLP